MHEKTDRFSGPTNSFESIFLKGNSGTRKLMPEFMAHFLTLLGRESSGRRKSAVREMIVIYGMIFPCFPFSFEKSSQDVRHIYDARM
jgi:hypothetical protein